MKYILLDEISLEVISSENGDKLMFNTEQDAVKYANKHCQSWQVIEIPFNN